MGRVAIVGAGPGGAVLALLLARRGVEVTLLERQHDFAREFRGEVLLPGGLEPFDQMGLWDEIERVPSVQMQGGVLYLNGRRRLAADFDPSTFGRFAPRWMSQPGLLEMLVRVAGENASFELRRGASVNALVTEAGRCVGVVGKDAEGDFEVRADLVVGADGRTSVVRRQAALPEHADPTPMDIVWLKVADVPAVREHPRLHACVGNGHLLIAAPVYDETLQVAWIIEKGRFGEIRRRGIPECLDDMAAVAPPWLADHLHRHREDASRPFLLSTVSDRVLEWSRPGLLVIGDAAHTMSPVGAQGLNIAIRDAVVAANHLVPVLEGAADPQAIDAANRAIEAERKPEVSEVQRLQARPPPVILSQAWWARAGLQLATGALSLLPRRQLGAGLRGLLSGVTDVKLRV